MNAALWSAQILVAVVVMLTGTTKLVFARERLSSRMHWAATWPRWRIKLLGLAEVAGGLGLVLPITLSIAPVLTPMAPLCLGMLMAGAIRTHRRLGEGVLPAVLISALCVAIAVGRLLFVT